ncbi:MAG TPA: papain-like cysteine protease family protein [Dongiaceae bacterium]|nr:papain-like cysteine protease family protein [Dongiaceae bacterium]
MSKRALVSRRHALAGIAALAALGPTRAFAGGTCSVIDQTTRQCTVGLQIGVETVRQRCENWCWAACIQAIFALHSYDIPQEAIVEKLFGDGSVCAPANDAAIVAAIDGGWIDMSGNQFSAYGQVMPLAAMGVSSSQSSDSDPLNLALNMTGRMFASQDIEAMLTELANNNPLIIGRMGDAIGHAMVLTAASFIQRTDGTIYLTELIVRDPWPGSPNRRRLSGDEIRETFTVIKVHVQA